MTTQNDYLDLESVIELQKIDCNCNDCKFMVRDFEKHKKSTELHYKWQFDYFNSNKNKLLDKVKEWRAKGDFEKADTLAEEVKKMRFQFDKSTVAINYGRCTRFDKDVSFIPSVCQIETQGCFKHRRE